MDNEKVTSSRETSGIVFIALTLIGLVMTIGGAVFFGQREIGIAVTVIGALLLFALAVDRFVAVADIQREFQGKLSLTESYLRKAKRENQECLAQKNAAYSERTSLAALLSFFYPNSGQGVDHLVAEGKDFRNLIFLDLPTGQVSFHCANRDERFFKSLAPYARSYDGHSKEVANERILAAIRRGETETQSSLPVVPEEPSCDLKGHVEEVMNMIRIEFIHSTSSTTPPETRLERAFSQVRDKLEEN